MIHKLVSSAVATSILLTAPGLPAAQAAGTVAGVARPIRTHVAPIAFNAATPGAMPGMGLSPMLAPIAPAAKAPSASPAAVAPALRPMPTLAPAQADAAVSPARLPSASAMPASAPGRMLPARPAAKQAVPARKNLERFAAQAARAQHSGGLAGLSAAVFDRMAVRAKDAAPVAAKGAPSLRSVVRKEYSPAPALSLPTAPPRVRHNLEMKKADDTAEARKLAARASPKRLLSWLAAPLLVLGLGSALTGGELDAYLPAADGPLGFILAFAALLGVVSPQWFPRLNSSKPTLPEKVKKRLAALFKPGGARESHAQNAPALIEALESRLTYARAFREGGRMEDFPGLAESLGVPEGRLRHLLADMVYNEWEGAFAAGARGSVVGSVFDDGLWKEREATYPARGILQLPTVKALEFLAQYDLNVPSQWEHAGGFHGTFDYPKWLKLPVEVPPADTPRSRVLMGSSEVRWYLLMRALATDLGYTARGLRSVNNAVANDLLEFARRMPEPQRPRIFGDLLLEFLRSRDPLADVARLKSEGRGDSVQEFLESHSPPRGRSPRLFSWLAAPLLVLGLGSAAAAGEAAAGAASLAGASLAGLALVLAVPIVLFFILATTLAVIAKRLSKKEPTPAQLTAIPGVKAVRLATEGSEEYRSLPPDVTPSPSDRPWNYAYVTFESESALRAAKEQGFLPESLPAPEGAQWGDYIVRPLVEEKPGAKRLLSWLAAPLLVLGLGSAASAEEGPVDPDTLELVRAQTDAAVAAALAASAGTAGYFASLFGYSYASKRGRTRLAGLMQTAVSAFSGAALGSVFGFMANMFLSAALGTVLPFYASVLPAAFLGAALMTRAASRDPADPPKAAPPAPAEPKADSRKKLAQFARRHGRRALSWLAAPLLVLGLGSAAMAGQGAAAGPWNAPEWMLTLDVVLAGIIAALAAAYALINELAGPLLALFSRVLGGSGDDMEKSDRATRRYIGAAAGAFLGLAAGTVLMIQGWGLPVATLLSIAGGLGGRAAVALWQRVERSRMREEREARLRRRLEAIPGVARVEFGEYARRDIDMSDGKAAELPQPFARVFLLKSAYDIQKRGLLPDWITQDGVLYAVWASVKHPQPRGGGA